MQRVLISLPVLFLVFFAGAASAQYVFRTPTPTPTPKPSPAAAPTPGPGACPQVSVQAQPGGTIRDGQRVVFNANIGGGDTRVVPMIVWSTTAGLVTQGHNTRRIEVDSTGAGGTPEREIRADVWVGGYAPECMLQASGSVKIIPPASKFGEFGEVDAQTLKTNLEALSTFLSQSPDNLFLIAYAGRNSERGFAYNWLKRIKDGLVEAGIASRRINALDGGFREQPLFDFWIVPAGAEPPRPAPTLKRSDIVFPKTTPSKKP